MRPTPPVGSDKRKSMTLKPTTFTHLQTTQPSCHDDDGSGSETTHGCMYNV
jgi:hypothetical protein